MQEKNFEQKRKSDWLEFDLLVNSAEKKKKGVQFSKLPSLLRKLSVDLSLARHRMYGSHLCEDLNSRVLSGFKIIENERGNTFSKIVKFFILDFPAAVRKEWKLHILTWLVVLIPALTIILATKYSGDMEWVNSVLGEHDKSQLDQMYGKGENALDSGRGEGGDMKMFGFYIWNNISIDFQIFAGGVIGGIGSLYILFFNAISFGATIAYIEAYGDPSKLYGFVSSHAPYELWAMMISGMAGLRVGFSLLMPGRRTRTAALQHAGRTAMTLIIGAACMTFLAAIIEGFWSANAFTSLGGVTFKVWVGFAGWAFLAVYFMWCGKGRLHEA